MQKSNDQGFSLVEVLVGVFIFTIGALASAVMIVGSMQTAEANKHRSAVSSLVSERMEEIRTRPWSSSGYEPSLASGGRILRDAELNTDYPPYAEWGFSDEVSTDLGDGYVNTYMANTYYLVMWQIEDLSESGIEYKRVTVKGVAMMRRTDNNRWQPKTSFDHVTMIFREERN